MPDRHYDVIVAGVGAMGSAACLHLARRGKRVLGLERFDVPNAMGSSHGVTRIIRLAYAEGERVRAAPPARLRALARTRGRGGRAAPLDVTGYVDVGDDPRRARRSSPAAIHDLRHELVDGRELARRHPAFRVPADVPALLQPDGGFLLSERCIVAHVGAGARARCRDPGPRGRARLGVARGRRGAGGNRARRLHAPTVWSSRPARGRPASAGSIPSSASPSARCSPGSSRARRSTSVRSDFRPSASPSTRASSTASRSSASPASRSAGFTTATSASTRIASTASRTRPTRRCSGASCERYFPDGAGPTMALSTCLFENSPDEHFVIDMHPDCEDVVVAAGFSGHGFKFASVVGEMLADLATRARRATRSVSSASAGSRARDSRRPGPRAAAPRLAVRAGAAFRTEGHRLARFRREASPASVRHVSEHTAGQRPFR